MSACFVHDLLKPLNRTCNHLSSNNDQLVVPRVGSKMGGRAFPVAPPPPALELYPSRDEKNKDFKKKTI